MVHTRKNGFGRSGSAKEGGCFVPMMMEEVKL